MSLYATIDATAPEVGKPVGHVVLCDRCLVTSITPTTSGMRLPDGWSTAWLIGGVRSDLCPQHPQAGFSQPYQLDNPTANADLARARDAILLEHRTGN